MTLSSGQQLGPYEVLAPLGAGGMGEVYRARDPRLGREVAIKVLPASYATEADRLHRFEQEARAAGQLNHPNLLALHDVGVHEGRPYLVSELLEGETLRERLQAGPLPPRKAVEQAREVALGLAAAHAKGIVHRDLKPENLFLTRDGRVKILDFGLAKLARPAAGLDTHAATVSAGTTPGAILGTLGYMSPEQARGQAADHRSDIFSLGAILYETLAGRRAFEGGSAADTLSAILKEDPPALSASGRTIPAALERIVRRCLEKNPEERFQSALDLAFGLDALAETSSIPGTATRIETAAPRRHWKLLAAAAALLAAGTSGFIGGRAILPGGVGATDGPQPTFKRVTFRRGAIASGRFTSDGHTIILASAWDGRPFEVHLSRLDSPVPKTLGLAANEILSVSSQSEMAIRVGRSLARAPLGGPPRPVLDDVQSADWSPDGRSLAVARAVDRRYRLEFPIGTVLYTAPEGKDIHQLRVSPNGDRVAISGHFDRETGIRLVDKGGATKDLAAGLKSISGIAWTPSGDALWFAAEESVASPGLYAVDLQGRRRLLGRFPGELSLEDVSRDGRLLVHQKVTRYGVVCQPAGETKERDFSWLDGSYARDISDDGTTLLFNEMRVGGGESEAIYLRRTDGSPPLRLGDGHATALSPDGTRVLAHPHGSGRTSLIVVPTGAGEPLNVKTEPVEFSHNATWMPDGRRVLFMGSEKGGKERLYVQDLSGGAPRGVTPEGTSFPAAVSPDSRFVAACRPGDATCAVFKLDGSGSVVNELAAGERPIRWSRDGRSLYVSMRVDFPARVMRVDLATGKREPWKELMPSDPAGIVRVGPALLTPDGHAYAYDYERTLSDLYVVEDMKPAPPRP